MFDHMRIYIFILIFLLGSDRTENSDLLYSVNFMISNPYIFSLSQNIKKRTVLAVPILSKQSVCVEYTDADCPWIVFYPQNKVHSKKRRIGEDNYGGGAVQVTIKLFAMICQRLYFTACTVAYKHARQGPQSLRTHPSLSCSVTQTLHNQTCA